MKMLEGKNTLVTGATRGIGRGIALEFAREGANVAFTFISNPDKANALAEELEAFGVKAWAFQVNASDADATGEMIKSIAKEWGSIDAVVNNAGITKDNLWLRMSEEQFDQVQKVNLYSVFYMTKALLRPMLKQRSGSIINISSIAGRFGL